MPARNPFEPQNKNKFMDREQGEKPKRKAGYYWVRFTDGDWTLGMWFFGNYWILPGSTKNLPDSYFKEINENIVCPQEPK